ncbi:hypothetical protein SAY87_013037 [Trapa incisa]|uniref:Uncharacterized protein n=1 Tax=Trapa incisa TaxID=236973 RepID=A0AAN7KAX8_9MYRT|nr:hypothetical protein SAY87_013037 [Trapa incisa]
MHRATKQSYNADMNQQHKVGAGKNGEKEGGKDLEGMQAAVRKAKATIEEQEDINKRANAFIKMFRNQLKIQREDSIKQFQEMIARGL